MSQIRVNNITNRTGIAGPSVAGIANVNSNSHFVVPTGRTGQRYADDGENIVRDGLVLYLDAKYSYPSKTGIGTTTSGAAAPAGSSTDVDVYTWYDMSGNENHGELINGVGYNSANGGSLVFDGIDDSINCGNILQLGTESRTYCCWYKLNSTTQVAAASLISKTDDSTTEYRQVIGFQTNGNFRVILRGQSNSVYDMDTTNPKIDLNWHYLVWVIDRGSNQSLYQDNVFLNSLSISAISSQNFQLNRPLRIGSYNTITDTPTSSLNGNIAQVSIYNRALTAQEVLQNYNATKSRFGL